MAEAAPAAPPAPFAAPAAAMAPEGGLMGRKDGKTMQDHVLRPSFCGWSHLITT